MRAQEIVLYSDDSENAVHPLNGLHCRIFRQSEENMTSQRSAIFLSAELGFLGVAVLTAVQTPLFCGEAVSVAVL